MENKKKRKFDNTFPNLDIKKTKFFNVNEEIYREIHILKYQISQIKQNYNIKNIVEQYVNSYIKPIFFNIDKEIYKINITNISLKNEILKINNTILELKNEIQQLSLMIDYKSKNKTEKYVSYIN